MERNNLLNLLIAGGIAIAIALGGASLGVAINNKSKSSSGASTEAVTNESSAESTNTLKKSGTLSLYGGFKLSTDARKIKVRQEIFEITVGPTEKAIKDTEVPVVAEAAEVQILDLSKTVGGIAWIRQQLKYPKANAYTDQISVKTLHKVGYKQKIVFIIKQKDKSSFGGWDGATFAVEVKTEHVAAVNVSAGVIAKAESWNLVLDLIAEPYLVFTDGVKAISTVAKINSLLLNEALANSKAILTKGIDILLWKTRGEANADSSDFDIAIILKKKTGQVYVYSDIGIKIKSQVILSITEPTLGS